MTDTLKGCIVTFDRDIRDDDVEMILNAIRMIKGVLNVNTSLVTPTDYMNRSRIRSELEAKLYKALHE